MFYCQICHIRHIFGDQIYSNIFAKSLHCRSTLVHFYHLSIAEDFFSDRNFLPFRCCSSIRRIVCVVFCSGLNFSTYRRRYTVPILLLKFANFSALYYYSILYYYCFLRIARPILLFHTVLLFDTSEYVLDE